jgi:hypothetical protein
MIARLQQEVERKSDLKWVQLLEITRLVNAYQGDELVEELQKFIARGCLPPWGMYALYDQSGTVQKYAGK